MHYPENETSYEIAQNDNVKYAIINKENLAVECKIYETATISEIQINTKNYFLIDKSKYSLEYKKFQKKSIQK